MIKGLIYDLDGTIIDTDELHRQAWERTTQEFALGLSGEELYSASKGISSKKTLEKLLPKNRYDIIPQAADAKFAYLMEETAQREVQILPGFSETLDQLMQRNLTIGVCTSTRQEFVEALLQNVNLSILSPLRGKIAWKEMFTEGKPSAEPLQVTLQLLGGITSKQALYIGDASADYGSAVNAGIDFFYFRGPSSIDDQHIPQTVPRLYDHRELLGYL